MKTQTELLVCTFVVALLATLVFAASPRDHEGTQLKEEELENEGSIESRVARTSRDVEVKLKTRNLYIKGVPGPYPTGPVSLDDIGQTDPETGATLNQGQTPTRSSNYVTAFNDPMWAQQWYDQDYRTAPGPVMDLNLIPVYEMGITGLGVNVAVVDSGIRAHADLKNKVQEEMSYNFATGMAGSMGVLEPVGESNNHGTVCAGIIGMEANNKECGVGVAFDANIIDLKIFDKKSEKGHKPEAQALVHRLETIDIYSCAWGAVDDGKSMFNLSPNIAASLKKGIEQGRSGKGAIYVFPSGAGRLKHDNCATDGHVNSPYTLAFAGATFDGHQTTDSERCAAVIATVYNKGATNKMGFVSIGNNGKCTSNIEGASVPLATGLIALLLQAKPELTFRDVQHVIARSAEVAPLANNPGTWYKNGAGFWVSNDFGFGMLNGENLVKVAKTWTLVPPETSCKFSYQFESKVEVMAGKHFEHEFEIDGCQEKEGETPRGVHFMETLETEWTISYPFRGFLQITIKSAKQTKTTLLAYRPLDQSSDGLARWPIKSLHNWGEDPKGKWQIRLDVYNPEPDRHNGVGAILVDFSLRFRGTTVDPQPRKQEIPGGAARSYSAFKLPGPYPTSPATASELGPTDPKTGATLNTGQMYKRVSHYAKAFTDSAWSRQIYFQDYRTAPGPVMDLNLLPVYEMGITGLNVIIGVVDQGISSHADLENKVRRDLSYNYADNVPLSNGGSDHGLICAGIIAMEANNKLCGVGVAFDATIIDIQIYSPTASINQHAISPEAQGFVHRFEIVDIYSSSWGSKDDGMNMYTLSPNVEAAINKGATKGRSGKGAIYVFPSGYGKTLFDNCATDGYVNHPFTLAFTGATFDGHQTAHSERCPAIIAAVYNKGATKEGAVAPSIGGNCMMNADNPAIAPLATGIIALLLQAKPELTIRDVQHIIARSAEVAPLANNLASWYKNAAGFWVSADFGFGLMNAENMVNIAKKWTLVPPEVICDFSHTFHKKVAISTGDHFEYSFDMDGCQEQEGGKPKGVHFLETLETEWTISYPFRGDLSINITSAQQTKTRLLANRPKDRSSEGLVEWPIKSLHNWGEDPKGTWTIRIDIANLEPEWYRGVGAFLIKFKLRFRGTTTDPQPKTRVTPNGAPRVYSAFKLPYNEAIIT